MFLQWAAVKLSNVDRSTAIKRLVATVVEDMLRPGYKLPSTKTISKSMTPQLYAKTEEKMKEKLKLKNLKTYQFFCIKLWSNGGWKIK